MLKKTTELPAGRDRYILKLVRTGLNRDVAYTLADDVSAMLQDSLMDKIDAQNEVIKAQSVKIDAFQGTLRDFGRSLDIATSTLIEHGKELREHGRAIRSLETRHAEALKASEARQADLIRESEARRTEALHNLEARWTEAIHNSEVRLTEALHNSEARLTKSIGSLDARLTRFLEYQIKLFWIVVGTGVLGMLGAIAKWAIEALGP